MSDLFPCFEMLGFQDKEWPEDVTPHAVATHYLHQLHDWAKDNKHDYSINAWDKGYNIEIEMAFDSSLEFELYIVPLELLFWLSWTDYSLCDLISKGLVILKNKLGIEGPGYWTEAFYECSYNGWDEDDDSEEGEREQKGKTEAEVIQETALWHHLLDRPVSIEEFKDALNAFGLDPRWRDWGEMVIHVVENLGPLDQFQEEGDDDYYYEEALPFSFHFLVGHTEGEVWDFIEESLNERIGNSGFHCPKLEIVLSKNTLKETKKAIEVVTEKRQLLYNLGEIFIALYNWREGETTCNT